MSQVTITGNIGGRNMDIIEFSKQVELDTYSKIDFMIPADNINIFDIRGADFEIYVDGTFLISGLVISRPSFQILDGKNCIKVSGVSELGRTSCERGYSLAYFQDELITSILATLLATSASGFVLDTSNFTDALTASTTIDLRSKETLFSQISAVIKSYPSLHMRETVVGGVNTLEIGEFDDLLYQSTQSLNLVDISLQADSTRVYNIVEAYGGLSPSVRVDLNDSLADGRAAASAFYAQFPIVVDGNGLAYVENTAINANCGTVKDFDFHKTDNQQTVSQTDIDDASFALYQKAVRFLQSTSEHQDFEINVLTNLENLKVGDRIQVVSKINEEYFNQDTMQFESVQIFTVNSDYRITNISTALEYYSFFEDNGVEIGHMYLYSIRVTNGEDTANYDEDTELYERLEKPQDLPSLDALQIAPPQSFSITHNEGVDPADCTYGGGTDGKLFTFDVATTAPTWATGKQVVVQAVTDTANYEVVQNVSTDLTDVIFCVTGLTPNQNWGGAGATDDVTFEILVIYT